MRLSPYVAVFAVSLSCDMSPIFSRLNARESGTCTLGEDISKKKEEEFSEARWGAATNAVIPSILRMSERKWQKVIERALEASNIGSQSTRVAPALPMHAPDDARALAYEPDSE